MWSTGNQQILFRYLYRNILSTGAMYQGKQKERWMGSQIDRQMDGQLDRQKDNWLVGQMDSSIDVKKDRY